MLVVVEVVVVDVYGTAKAKGWRSTDSKGYATKSATSDGGTVPSRMPMSDVATAYRGSHGRSCRIGCRSKHLERRGNGINAYVRNNTPVTPGRGQTVPLRKSMETDCAYRGSRCRTRRRDNGFADAVGRCGWSCDLHLLGRALGQPLTLAIHALENRRGTRQFYTAASVCE